MLTSILADDFLDSEVMKLLLSAWPGGIKKFCEEAGFKSSRLNAYLNERAVMSSNDLFSLRSMLQVWIDNSTPEIGPTTEMEGSYVLTSDLPRSKLIDLYDNLSHGGDLLLSCEVLPGSGPPDANRRFLVLSAHGSDPTVIVFARGSANESLLDDGEAMINYSGPVRVKRELFDRVRLAADYGFQCPVFASFAGNLFSSEWFSLTDRLEMYYGTFSLCQVHSLEDPFVPAKN